MSNLTTAQLIQYYAGLLILQYIGQPKANAHIQTLANPAVMPQTSSQSVSFSDVATSGAFELSYDGNTTASISWDATTATIQTALQAIAGLSSVLVSGTIASQNLSVIFVGVTPPALSLLVAANTLVASATPISIAISETDLTIPLAVQNAFQIGTAAGVQLDIIGKYAGVTRNGFGIEGPITLDDADFTRLIQIAIVTNNSGSSLATIQNLLFTYFPDEILVFDYTNMRLSYYINSTVGSQELAEVFVSEGLLPKPMGVQLASVIYSPNILSFFGMRTYQLVARNVSPFNDYTSYQTDWPWLSYTNAIVI